MSEIEDTLKRITSQQGVEGLVIVNAEGIPIRSNLDNDLKIKYASLITQLTAQARSVVRDLNPQNDLTFLRVRTKFHEILVAPVPYPMTVILGTDDIIRRGYKDDNLFSILESASKIKTIVDKMLQFVVIENDQSTKELGNSKEQLRPQVVNNEAVANIHKSDTIQKFLIVDDNRTSLKIMSEIIRSSGHLVKTAEDGQKCLDLLNECGLTFFDVLIIDEEMPFLTGSEVIAKLREMERSTGTRMFVISSSGHNDASFIKYIKECGADEVLMKPFKRDELFRMCGISIDKKLL
ncbi:dynein light chain [Acrasis kona]|uniref:Dynein light chain n=1 Tax=Acrasis kona TaxID=1008807 RepID=A0AAW2ZB96_9EUKA